MLTRLVRSYKVYTKEEVLKPLIGRSYKNLIEMAGGYKCKGVGMKFWRKSWPKDSFFTVTKIDFKTIRLGKAWGVLTWEGTAEAKEKEIKGVLKLGTWQHADPAQEKNNNPD